MNSKKLPHFLEVFLPNLSSQRLEVPSKFVKHFEGRTSGLLSFTGPSGNSWHVDLVEHKGRLFFQGGWPTFVKDHSIQCGVSLVFRYDGNLQFTVQIFDQSSCEKDEAFYVECSQQSLNSDANLRKRRVREKETSFFNVLGEKKCRGSSSSVLLDLPFCDKDKELEFCTNESADANSAPESFDASKKPILLALPCSGNTDWMASVVKSHSNTKVSYGKKKAAKKKQKAGIAVNTSISMFIESIAAEFINSSFPYFVRVMNYSNIRGNGTMKIPIKFSEVHLPNCRVKVTLKNLNGDCWTINSVPTAKNRSTVHSFCGGWLAFVRGNGLKIEDVCIFEFVGQFEMLVRILRLGVEGLDTQPRNSGLDVSDTETCGGPLEIVNIGAQETTEDYFLNNSENFNELCISEDEGHTVNGDRMSATQEELAALFDTSGEPTVQRSFDLAAPLPMLRVSGESKEETLSWATSRENESDFLGAPVIHNRFNSKEATEAISFTSPFPNFKKVMMNSNVGRTFTLVVPRKFSAAHLPSHKTEIVLRNLNGDSWNVVSTRYGLQTKFCGGWMSFVRKNGVKLGDICVFELVDKKVLQVRVFEADQMGQEYLNNDTVAEASTASDEARQCILLPLE